MKRPASIPTYESRSFAIEICGNDGARSFIVKATPYFQTFLNRYKVGDQLTLTLTDKKPKRTEAQSRYYWVYVSEIAKETGNEPEDLHELFKAKFLPRKRIDVLGETIEQHGSTKNLTRLEFGEFLDKIEEMTGVAKPPLDNIRGL